MELLEEAPPWPEIWDDSRSRLDGNLDKKLWSEKLGDCNRRPNVSWWSRQVYTCDRHNPSEVTCMVVCSLWLSFI